jgi:hypothetical protein
MREYGKLKTSFWRNQKVRLLSDQSKLLAAYLISCPHGNALGCFVLPLGYICEDLGWVIETVSERLAELFRIGYFERDEKTDLFRIIPWWEHNTLENPNVAKRALAEFSGLPNCELKHHLAESMEQFAKWFPKGLPNGSGNGSAMAFEYRSRSRSQDASRKEL